MKILTSPGNGSLKICPSQRQSEQWKKEMDDLYCYKEMPEWDSHTLPAAFRDKHNTKEGVWAKLTILKGKMDFAFLTETGEIVSTHVFSPENQPPFVEPQRWHRIVSFTDDLQCRLAFFCKAEDYCTNRYGLTRTHSEVIEAAAFIPHGRVLDLGCGKGRNTLYLNLLGFDVTAYDRNADGIAFLNAIVRDEGLSRVHAEVFDINKTPIAGTYDLIVSTVVLMFLQPERIPLLLRNMQDCTAPGGYNLIVSAMDTPDYPCVMPFPFTLKSGELRACYQDWDIVKYNEDPGELHRTDADGNRIRMRFSTLLARKK